jgi:hypothetical protein
VDVTADDIERPLDRGPSRMFDCPIARAISRVWPYPVSVAGTCAHLYDSDRADRQRAEEILLSCVSQFAAPLDRESQAVQLAMERRYFIDVSDLTPRVFYRLTDNWLELTIRFVVRDHGVRDVKDAIARAVLKEFERASIEVASATYEVVGLPTLKVRQVEQERGDADRPGSAGRPS